MDICDTLDPLTLISDHPRVIKDEPMSRHTSFRIGGPAQYLALPESIEELIELLLMAKQADLEVTIIGGGSNLLVSDNGLLGLVVCTKQMKSGIQLTKDSKLVIKADAGENLASLVRFSKDNALGGLEFAAGIPGTLGGAIAMNAGIPERSMEDIVDSVTLLDLESLSVLELKREKLLFSYRNLELDNFLILGARLLLEKASLDGVAQKINENIRHKKQNQPVQLASAGCFFKNPSSGPSAGYLIDKAGFKGMRYKQARVSEIHANYIINLGKASCVDVLDLASMIEDKVFEKFNIRLEPEIKVVNHE